VRLGIALASAAARYWLVVFPRVCLELRRSRRLARRIADPSVRDAALAALEKRSNMEGAAAFAAIGPSRRSTSAVRALVAFQTLYNHADTVAERFAGESIERARDAHASLLAAFEPVAPALDAPEPADEPCASAVGLPRSLTDGADADYVAALLDTCRDALSRLPSSVAISAPARRAAERIVCFQSLSVGRHGELERWAREAMPAGAGTPWWEVAAAAGSSLGVHALIAAAASPSLDARTIIAIDDAYFPTIGALHSLLDSLVDVDEDVATGQLRLIDCYDSPAAAAAALANLARAALAAARALPHGHSARLLIAAMACSYLSCAGATTRDAEPIARDVRAALGPIAAPLLLVFAIRRAGRRPSATARDANRVPAPISADACEQGANARAA
jgi:tetraprenyl-beta-curcumene synthase